MRGRNFKGSTMINGRQDAIAVDGTVITFKCRREGHTYKIDFGRKGLPVSRRMGPSGCKMMASWWSSEKGGCIGECPKCERAAKAATKASAVK